MNRGDRRMIRKLTGLTSVVSFTLVFSSCGSDEEKLIGKDGQNGANASPCTVQESEDGTIQIQCPDGSSTEIVGGQTGEDGTPGRLGAPGKAGPAGLPGEPGTNGLDGELGRSCSLECINETTARAFCDDGSEVQYPMSTCGELMLSPALLSVSAQHACRIGATDSKLTCWGQDSSQQIGNGVLSVDQTYATSIDARQLPLGFETTWQQVSAGGGQTCALTTSGAAYCWGAGTSGTLTLPTPLDTSNLPVGTQWRSLSVGASRTVCGITWEGVGYCWGAGSSGQRGDGNTSAQDSGPTPIDVSDLPEGTTWSSLSVGSTHACGITTTGTAYCWGSDDQGKLGNGRSLTALQSRPSPVDLRTLPEDTTWLSLSAGSSHTCGVTAAGVAYCWGSDAQWQLGRGGVQGASDYPRPVSTSELPDELTWARISAGEEHSCAVTQEGTAYCWGNASSGRLGIGDSHTSGRVGHPTAVSTQDLTPGTKWVEVQAAGASSCGLTHRGDVYCWGSSARGKLGNGVIEADQAKPQHPVDTIFGVFIEDSFITAAIGDSTNQKLSVSLIPVAEGSTEELVLSATSSNVAVIPPTKVTHSGSKTERVVSFEPVARGTSTISISVQDAKGRKVSFPINYAASSAIPDSTGRYHTQISDASAALDVGDGYMLLGDDETNVLFLHHQEKSGPPLKVWDFTQSGGLGHDELDIEAVGRSGSAIVWITSHGNARDGDTKERRRVIFGTTITGSGANTELTFRGRYGGGPGDKREAGERGIWRELISWDSSNQHGFGANYLKFAQAARDGVQPNAPHGFNIEGFEFAADGTTGYLGFRAPTILVGGKQHALIVPVTNILDLVDGVGPQTGRAQFGAPILLDLAGRSIRALSRNASGQFFISAGPPDNPIRGVNDTWALYIWDGDPTHAPVLNQELPSPDLLTGGVWECIVSVPDPVVPGALFRLVTDSGDTDYYGTGRTKDLVDGLQKSYSQLFTVR